MFQPEYPLKLSNQDGAYKSIKEIKQNIKQNVLFLIATSPGEWPGNPELGVGVRNYLFSTYGTQEMLQVHSRIKDQFSRFLPFLEVKSELIDVDVYGNKLIDSNEIKLRITYKIGPLDEQDFVDIGVAE